MKRAISLLICLMLLLSVAVPAYATGGIVSLAVTPDEDQNQEIVSPDPPFVADPGHEHEWRDYNTATCTEGGQKGQECVCGAITAVISGPLGHDYGDPEKLDEKEHELTCSRCGDTVTEAHTWDSGKVTAQPTCKAAGIRTYTCTECEATKTESIPTTNTHSFGEWQHDASGHKRVCAGCKAQESGNHSWKETVTKKATCDEAGTKVKKCTVCEYVGKETIVIPKLDHKYDNACDEKCNVCGEERTVQHSYTTVWSSNSKGHWHECTKCGDQKDFAAHNPGPAATEEKEQLCLTCNYVITPKKQHVHSYGSEWTNDEVGHWHACTSCEEERDYSAHVYDNDCDEDCNTCGYEREDAHTYDKEGWMTSSFAHWNVCTVCGASSEQEAHIPGEEATEEQAQLCTVCGIEIAPKLEHTHDFGTAYLTDELTHWQQCECGELSVPMDHIWDAGKENRDDTITFTCTVCGEEKVEEAPDSGFSWLTLILVILALLCLGGIGVLVYFLKKGAFDEPQEEEEPEIFEDAAEEVAVPELEPEADPEEKMIDDFFASLDETK